MLHGKLHLIGFFALISILFIPAFLYAQSDVLRLYEQDEFKELEKKVASEKDDLFLQSLFMTDAKKAIEAMKGIIQKDQHAKTLPAIMERVGLYQFSQGLYNAARKSFKFLSENFPNTSYGEMGLYYTARCFQALGKSDSSNLILETFLRDYPRSKYSNLILEELRSGLKLRDDDRVTQKTETDISGKPEIFTVQTGAFSTKTNAKIQKQFLEEKGVFPKIYIKWVNRKKYYVVCLRDFKNKTEAEKFAREIAKKYKFDYRVIEVRGLQLVPE